MWRRSKAIEARLAAIERSLSELVHETDLVKTVLMVQDPESGLAAGAFEGLRRQVVRAATARRDHLGQVATMDARLSELTDIEGLRLLVQDWVVQAGLVVVRTPPSSQDALHEQFELVGEGGFVEQVLQCAYLDPDTGSVIRKGRIRIGGSPIGLSGEPDGLNHDDSIGASGTGGIALDAPGVDEHVLDTAKRLDTPDYPEETS